MAKLFISHSSQDKPFARKLYADLKRHGHEPWIDEERIKVGENIASAIEQSLTEADFLIVILSPRSVKSRWVEAEWTPKFWSQVSTGRVQLLPVVFENCVKPTLLNPYKHADFSENYVDGFKELLKAINPSERMSDAPLEAVYADQRSQIFKLISKVQSGSVTVSECLADALPIADAVGSDAVVAFCRHELTGWDVKMGWSDDETVVPSYRIVEAYWLPLSKVNLQHPAFRGNSGLVFQTLRGLDQCTLKPTFVNETVPTMEHMIASATVPGVLLQQVPMAAFLDDSSSKGEAQAAGATINVYFPPDTFHQILQSVRKELTRHLMSLVGKRV